MGLDMYAYAVKNTALNKFDTDIELPETGKEVIAYWHGFEYVNEFFEDLYFDRGGIKELFNVTTVRVDETDLNDLEKSIKDLKYEIETGSLGEDDGMYMEDVDATLTFITHARYLINEGYVILYYTWW